MDNTVLASLTDDAVGRGLDKAPTGIPGLDAITAGGLPRRLDLPTYAFQRDHYWLSSTALASRRAVGADAVEGGFWEAVDGRFSQSSRSRKVRSCVSLPHPAVPVAFAGMTRTRVRAILDVARS